MLISSTVTATETIEPETLGAPKDLTPYPKNLPDGKRLDKEATLIEGTKQEALPKGTTILPPSWEGPLSRRLLECSDLDKSCARIIEKNNTLWRAAMDAAVALTEAQTMQAAANTVKYYKDPSSWEQWQVGLAIGAAVLGSVLVGFLSGYFFSGMGL